MTVNMDNVNKDIKLLAKHMKELKKLKEGVNGNNE